MAVVSHLVGCASVVPTATVMLDPRKSMQHILILDTFPDLFGKDCVIFCKDCEVKDEGCKHHAEALYIRFHLGLEEDEVAPNDIGSRMSQHSALSREDSVSLFDCVADLDKRFREHETKVDRRLSKIEELLEKLMVKLD